MWETLIANIHKIALFLIGAAIALNETFLREGAERPFLLALAGTAMGLPFMLGVDKRFQKPDLTEGEGEERWSHLP